LTPTQLKREIRRIACGENGLAERLGVRRAEVRQWLAGENVVPEVVASDIRRMPSPAKRPPRHP
jgi:DNA-binding transcriptional regulator YdaS (Cro superfamily)